MSVPGRVSPNFDSCVRLVKICVQEFYWGDVRINTYREVKGGATNPCSPHRGLGNPTWNPEAEMALQTCSKLGKGAKTLDSE